MNHRWQRILLVLLSLLAVTLLVLHWRAANGILCEYAFRPVAIEVAALNLPGEQTLASPCETVTVHLETLSLTGTGTRIRGQIEQHHHADYQLQALQLGFTNKQPDPWLMTQVVSDLNWAYRDETRWAEWYFPHKDTDINLGDSPLVNTVGSRLAKDLDIAETIPVQLFGSTPLTVSAEEEGDLRIDGVHLGSDETQMVVTHLPGDSLTRAVSSGASFELLVGPITDETGQHGPFTGSATWSPGEPVTRTLPGRPWGS